MSETPRPKVYHDIDGSLVGGISLTRLFSQEHIDGIISTPVQELMQIGRYEVSSTRALGDVLMGMAENIVHGPWVRWKRGGVIGALDELSGFTDQYQLTGRHESRLRKLTLFANGLYGFNGFIPVENVIMRPPGYKRSADWKVDHLLQTFQENRDTPIILVDNEPDIIARAGSIAQQMQYSIFPILMRTRNSKHLNFGEPEAAGYIHTISNYRELPAVVRKIAGII